MNSFRNDRLRNYSLPMSTAWLLSDIAESKGKQEWFTQQSPQALKVLRETALIQSVESSNRIEGVTVASGRLRSLVLGKTEPRDRSEQDVHGYRQALNEIHAHHANLVIAPNTLLRLHALCQSASGDAGQFKKVNNEIIQLVPEGPPIIRFRCLTADETPSAVDELCIRYRYALDQDNIPPLVAVAALVLDFLCIHPFRDGNGRVSRLLTLLALYHHGYEVGRYVSLERMIEDSKEDYYECLHRSSQHWHQSRHDLTPWLNFLLSIIRRCYVEFELRAGQVRVPRGAKTHLVESAISMQVGTFRVSDIQRVCPGVGLDMIRRVLKNLRGSKVECLGRGPNAQWRRLTNG